MATPTRYERGYGFAAYQASSPADPLPGDRLDIELDNVSQSLTETIGALRNLSGEAGETSGDLLNIRAFGAVGDGVTDDYTAIQAAIDAAPLYGGIYIPSGRYYVSAPPTISHNYFTVLGEGEWSSQIVSDLEIDMFRVDFTAAERKYIDFINIGFAYTGLSAPAAGCGVRFYESTGTPLYAVTRVSFINVAFVRTYYGIVVDKAHLMTFDGYAQIAEHGNCMFSDIHIPYNAGWTQVGIWFKGGPGAHNSFRGGSYQCADACIRMGDGSTNGGMGDQLFYGLHLLDADYGIDLVGPSGAGRYNRNVTIDVCHFENPVASVRARRMSDFRIGPCSSTKVATYDIDTCWNYSIQQTENNESRYRYQQAFIPAATLTVDLFDITLSDPTDVFTALWVEVWGNIVVGGVGVRPLMWRGFCRYTSTGWNAPAVELNFNGSLTGSAIALAQAATNSKIRATLTLTGATLPSTINADIKVLGRNYTLTIL